MKFCKVPKKDYHVKEFEPDDNFDENSDSVYETKAQGSKNIDVSEVYSHCSIKSMDSEILIETNKSLELETQDVLEKVDNL